MLSSIKDKAQGPVFKGFMFLLAISFVGWGVGDFLRSQSFSAPIKVDGTEISAQTFERAWKGQYSQLEQQVGADTAKQIAREMQLDQRLVSGMVDNTLVQNAAKKLKLVATDPMIAGTIRNQPYFAGPDGKFDQARFEVVLRNAELTPRMFENMVVDQVRDDTLMTIFSTVSLVDPKAFERYVTQTTQTRDVKVLSINEQDVAAAAEPTEQQLKDAYVDRKEDFKTEEKRDVSVLVLDITPFMANVKIDQAKLADMVKEATARVETDAPRHSRHILVSSEAEAKEIVAKLKSGADFASLAKEKSLDKASGAKGGDLGYAGRGVMVPSFEEALFNLKSGEISAPVQSDFGWHVIQLLDVKPVAAADLAKARAEAEATLKHDAAEPEFMTLQENIDDRIAGGETLDTIAKGFKLSVHRYPGLPQSGNGTEVIGGQQVLAEAFRLNEGEMSAPLTLAPQKVAYVTIANVVPADYKPFEDVREQLAKSLRAQATNSAMRDLATKLIDQFNAGKTLEGLAAEYKLHTPVQTVNNLGHQSQGSSPLISNFTLEMLFSAGNNKLVQGVQNVPGGVGLVQVVGIHNRSVGEAERRLLMQNLHATYQKDVYNVFMESLKANADIEIDQKAISRITGIERDEK